MKSDLLYHTPARWARGALTDFLALLSDHAYLERKAASNALDLLNRWPEPDRPDNWVTTLAGIAKDEAMHLNAVTKLIKKKGGHLERLHRSRYAADLRKLVRKGLGPHEIVDRLLISALIEARSCERFELLATHCPDKELATLYSSLEKSEQGHYHVFLNLAKQVLPPDEVETRWKELLHQEAEIIQSQEPGPGIHSGILN